MRTRIVLVVVFLMLVVVACGGGGGAPSTTSGGTATTVGPGTQAPATTQPAPSGEESIIVEIEGTVYEFSEVGCSYFSSRGVFWIVADETDNAGNRVEDGWGMGATLLHPGDFPAREGEDNGFNMTGPGRSYYLDEDDPGTWTISGTRVHGELNVTYGEFGSPEWTTARIDFTCSN